MGSFGQHEVVVCLTARRAAGSLADVDEAAVHRSGRVGHRAFEQQLALGPGGVVVLQGPEVVDLLVGAQIGGQQ